MNLIKEIKESLSVIELKQLKPIIKYIIVPAILFYSLSFVILKRSGFETMEIIRDTAQITNESSFLGFLSNIGIWLWVSSAAICFFAFFSRKDLKKNHRELLLI